MRGLAHGRLSLPAMRALLVVPVALAILAIPFRASAAPTAGSNRLSPGAASAVTIADDPRCGRGYTSAARPDEPAYTCFHSAADPLPDIDGPLAGAASAVPTCQGNGVNGPRIQLLYMYVEGQPDRTAVMVPRIINEFVPRMEGMFRETSRLQGREVGMRLHMPGCQLQVDTLMIDAEAGAPRENYPQWLAITDAVRDAGYDTTDRKYVLWFDGGTIGACGVAPVGGYPAVMGANFDRVPPLRDNPTPVNASNVGWAGGYEIAVVFRYGRPLLGAHPHVTECWGRGGTGARTEVHELLHLLGSVNASAPNWNGMDAHCIDGNDLMCYPVKGAKPMLLRCDTQIEMIDCGGDDYFNARPAAGSYLSTHWNIANSRFLGDAVVHDEIPLDLPRP